MISHDCSRTILWLAESGVRTPDGGVLSWLNPDHPGFDYPEAAGLALRLFVYLDVKFGTPRFAEEAERAARALIPRVGEDGGVGINGTAYAFDTAVCLDALYEFCRARRNAELPEKGLRMADFVKRSLLERRAAISRNGTAPPDKWSTRFGPHLLKTAIALHKTGGFREASGEGAGLSLDDFYDRLVDELFKGGRFVVEPGSDLTYTHSHCYAAEGLAFLCSTGRSRYFSILEASAQWLADAQNADGSFFNWHGSGSRELESVKVADAAAQAVRIWLMTNPSDYSANIDKSMDHLQGRMSPDRALRYSGTGDDLNSWATVFFIQAEIWRQYGAEPGQII